MRRLRAAEAAAGASLQAPNGGASEAEVVAAAVIVETKQAKFWKVKIEERKGAALTGCAAASL